MNDDNRPPFVLGDKAYGIAKWLIVIVLPAMGTLYYALSKVWGWPNGEEVLGTIIASQAFFGLLLGISHISYKNSDARFFGDINITEHDTGAKTVSLDLNHNPEKLESKDEVTFKVQPVQKA